MAHVLSLKSADLLVSHKNLHKMPGCLLSKRCVVSMCLFSSSSSSGGDDVARTGQLSDDLVATATFSC